MKKIKLMMSLAVVLIASMCYANDNLLKNGGFEQGFDGWKMPPSTWVMGKNLANPEIDETTTQANSKAALLMGNNETRSVRIYQSFKTKAKKLKITGYFKTENLAKPWFGRIGIQSSGKGWKFLENTVVVITKTANSKEWKYFSKTIDLPADTIEAKIIIELTVYGKTEQKNQGKLWFDQLSMTAVTAQKTAGKE